MEKKRGRPKKVKLGRPKKCPFVEMDKNLKNVLNHIDTGIILGIEKSQSIVMKNHDNTRTMHDTNLIHEMEISKEDVRKRVYGEDNGTGKK